MKKAILLLFTIPTLVSAFLPQNSAAGPVDRTVGSVAGSAMGSAMSSAMGSAAIRVDGLLSEAIEISVDDSAPVPDEGSAEWSATVASAVPVDGAGAALTSSDKSDKKVPAVTSSGEAAPAVISSDKARVPAAALAGEQLYEVTFEVRITPGWHIYDLGPYDIPSMATSFDFSASTGAELVGEPRQLDTPRRKFDDIFGFEVGTFEGTARFAQKVMVTADNAVLGGEIEYQVCSDGQCIRGVWEFDVPLTGGGKTSPAVANGMSPEGGGASGKSGGLGGTNAISTSASLSATGDRDGFGNPNGNTNNTNNANNGNANDYINGMRGKAGGGSLWAMILEAILWGFAALLTPCVFPMVPMTVSFFMKSGGSTALGRFRALMFGLFIILLYTLPLAVIILITRFAGGEAVTADIFNWLSTHWIPNLLFFIVFMLFAASLLGAFEFRLPSKLINRSDRGAERGGLLGIFFLALTLVLVSFSCTGPIVGTVLIKSTQGEFWAPIITMFFFSAAFALPFMILAFFPGLLERLPKSGGWMNSVKVVLAMIEIALGLKFLSVADQTYHWEILSRETYLAIWIVVFSIMGLYFLGKIRFKYDSPTEHVGVVRLGLAIVVFTFVVRLVPGLWGAPLSELSGYLPPMSTQEFMIGAGNSGTGNSGTDNTTTADPTFIKYSDILHLPHGLTGYFDLEQGLAEARRTGKPVFLDFTGHGCVNCREMEQRVWVDPEVQRILREKYVIVALYSDDRTRLPESEWSTTSAGKALKTLGRKNSYLVNTRYGISAQPAYLLLDGNGNRLAPVYGYDLDVASFVKFLKNE